MFSFVEFLPLGFIVVLVLILPIVLYVVPAYIAQRLTQHFLPSKISSYAVLVIYSSTIGLLTYQLLNLYYVCNPTDVIRVGMSLEEMAALGYDPRQCEGLGRMYDIYVIWISGPVTLFILFLQLFFAIRPKRKK